MSLYRMAKERLRVLLKNRGYHLGAMSMEAAVKAFQKYAGLKEDGIAGRLTERILELPRICGHPDMQAARGETPKWHEIENLTWTCSGSLRGISASEFKSVCNEAFKAWEKVGGASPRYVSSRTANCVIKPERIDGRGSILAQMEIPQGTSSSTMLRGWADEAEPFVAMHPGPDVPLGKIDLFRVMTHEIGHWWGILHIPKASGTALMNPIYNPSCWVPQELDIKEFADRYGAVSRPEPDPGRPESGVTVFIPGAKVLTDDRPAPRGKPPAFKPAFK